jgi:hypothetical protein
MFELVVFDFLLLSSLRTDSSVTSLRVSRMNDGMVFSPLGDCVRSSARIESCLTRLAMSDCETSAS